MKNYILTIALICPLFNTGICQVQEQHLQLNKGHYTINEIFLNIQQQLDIDIGYVANELNKDEVIELTPGKYKLDNLMERLFPKSEYKVLFKPGKILIKKNPVSGQNSSHIYGYVIDAETGEKLIGATVMNAKSNTGTTTNAYGYFSLPANGKEITLYIRYLGYETKTFHQPAMRNTPVYIAMTPDEQVLSDVVITEDALYDKLRTTESGLTKIDVGRLKAAPALAGETDVLKSIQMLPGVQTVGEGTSVYYVRGGNYDQNLILLDEAPVYNPSHALGFFSVFNSDAIKDLSFYKVHMPVEYGGKLSSVLDIRMKDGNLKRHSVSGGLGLISSRLMAEGPLVKNKSSYMISGRRTYADFIWKTLSSDEATKNTSIYFYDLNTKLNYKLGKKDHLYVSGFFGRDVNKIDVQQYNVVWDNKTMTLRWNHLFSDNLFSNTSLIYSQYNYDIGISGVTSNLSWNSTIRDYTAVIDFDWFPNQMHSLKFGLSSTFHRIAPGMASGSDNDQLSLSNANALEHVAYIEDDIRFSKRLSISVGLRGTAFQNIGESTLYHFNDTYQLTDSSSFAKGDIYNTFYSIDPRLSANFSVNSRSSLKASYNKTSQFIHFVQNNLIPFSAFDQWVISNPNIKPQYAHHVNMGYHYHFKDPGLGISADIFYKKMENQLDAADHAQLLLNRHVEGDLRSGYGNAYGVEVGMEKPQGVWQGYLGYTYARAKRTIRDINNGNTYNAPFDKPHAIQSSIVYHPNARLMFGANWTYSTGGPVTLPSETFYYDDKQVPIYSGRNQYRMPDYHRLDVSLTLKRKPNKNVDNQSSWVFALYNVYARKNASSVFSSPKLNDEGIDIVDPTTQLIYKSWLFSIVPSITYNFKF